MIKEIVLTYLLDIIPQFTVRCGLREQWNLLFPLNAFHNL